MPGLAEVITIPPSTEKPLGWAMLTRGGAKRLRCAAHTNSFAGGCDHLPCVCRHFSVSALLVNAQQSLIAAVPSSPALGVDDDLWYAYQHKQRREQHRHPLHA